MKIDSKLIQLFNSLSVKLKLPFWILDSSGNIIYPGSASDKSMTIPESARNGITCEYNGNLFARAARRPAIYACINNTGEASGDRLALIVELINAHLMLSHPFADKQSAYHRIILESPSSSEIVALANKFKITLNQNRVIIAIFPLQEGISLNMQDWKDTLLCGDGDDILMLGNDSAIMIKSTDDFESQDDIMQFARAMEQSFKDEYPYRFTFSIGEARNTLQELGESYRQAVCAFEAGRLFRPNDNVFDYTTLILERLILETPDDICEKYCSLIFNAENASFFTDEMLRTISMFFEKDLNLSDTSRQLFIHRNTLVYRLEKVQRMTGLDLRRLSDAVTFKLLQLMNIKKQYKPVALY